MAERLLAWEQKNIMIVGWVITALMFAVGAFAYCSTGDIVMVGAWIGGGYVAIILANIVVAFILCVIGKWKSHSRRYLRTCQRRDNI